MFFTRFHLKRLNRQKNLFLTDFPVLETWFSRIIWWKKCKTSRNAFRLREKWKKSKNSSRNHKFLQKHRALSKTSAPINFELGNFWHPTAPEQSLIVKRIRWKRASSSALEHCGRFYLSAGKVKKWRRKFRFIWKLCSFNIYFYCTWMLSAFSPEPFFFHLFVSLAPLETGAKKKCRKKTLGYGEIFLFSKLALFCKFPSTPNNSRIFN